VQRTRRVEIIRYTRSVTRTFVRTEPKAATPTTAGAAVVPINAGFRTAYDDIGWEGRVPENRKARPYLWSWLYRLIGQ
jgi:hypothetical protein